MSPEPALAPADAPLLDPAQADAVLAVTSPAEAVEMRGIFAEMVEISLRQFGEAAAAGPDRAPEIKRVLHSLKGGTASFGLARCAAQLRHAEQQWLALAPEQRSSLLAAARASFAAGVAELRARFPYLAGT